VLREVLNPEVHVNGIEKKKCFRYPYVFLNEGAFMDQFKECVTLFMGVDYTPFILTALATRRAGEWLN
jgi:hypothetical protein